MSQIKAFSQHNNTEFIHDFSRLQGQVRKAPYSCVNMPEDIWKLYLENGKHFGAEFWVAYIDNRPVARIGASRAPHDPSAAFFGFFEMDLSAEEEAKALYETAEHWAREQGLKKLIGPVNFNTWFPYRFKTNSTQSDKEYFWEPVNPPQYPQLIESLGYSSEQKYHTVCSGNMQGFAEKAQKNFERAAGAGYTFRNFDMENFIEKEVPILYDISIKGFKDNYLYSPIALEQFRGLYVGTPKQMDFSYSQYALDMNGKEVGFFFVFAQDEYIVMKSTTVVPEHRGKGISNAVLYPAFKRAMEEGKKGYISALMIAGAQSESYSKHGDFLWSHEYHLYGKQL